MFKIQKLKILALLVVFMFLPGLAKSFTILTPESEGTLNKTYTPANAPTLTVATYNIAAARVGSLEKIARAIKAMKADIVTINEIDNNTKRSGNVNQLEVIKKLSGMKYGIFGKAIKFDGGEYGVAILSRYPIVSSDLIKLPNTKEEQRVLLAAEIKVPKFNSNIVFMTTHLDWNENPELRIKQVYAIDNYVIGNTDAKIKDIASKIKILAGDFNDVLGSAPLKEFSRYFNNLVPSNIDNRTWPASNPALDIDHILAFKGQKWQVVKANIPNSSKETATQAKISDHVPVILKLKLLEQ